MNAVNAGRDQCNAYTGAIDGPRANGGLLDSFLLPLPGAALMNTNRRKFLTIDHRAHRERGRGQHAPLGCRERRGASDGRLQGHRVRVPVRRQRLEQHDRPGHGLRAVRGHAHGGVERRRSRRRSCFRSMRRARASPYGFHPSLAPLAPTYASGKLAVIANAGTLVTPLTQAQYKNPPAGFVRPSNLFSHSDQTNAWMGQITGQSVATGWGGRAGGSRRASPPRARRR